MLVACRSKVVVGSGRAWFSSCAVAAHASHGPGFPENKLHHIPTSGTYPLGFRAGSVHAGVKKKAGAKDLVLVSSEHACTAAAVFTTNAFAAAPVKVSRKLVEGQSPASPIYNVVVNSGCANACTGDQGLEDALTMSKITTESARAINGTHGTPAPNSLVMSTGVIGQPLPIDKIASGIEALAASGLKQGHEGWMEAAVGIMTTDTFPKLRSKEFVGKSGKYRMAGWCKGAGMIHPNMATMLSSVFTDMSVSRECLDKALKYAVSRSFNAISIDGDTSTNDTLTVLANGAANAGTINDPNSPEFLEFQQNLTEFSAELAKLIVRDGEGATKFVDVRVSGARSFDEAMTVASTISTSPLVKTAIYGRDANWGRIVCAVGYSGVQIVPEKVNLHMLSGDEKISLHLFKDGAPFDVNEDVAAKILEGEDVIVHVDLGLGQESANMYTCDFSTEYVKINGDYRS